MLGGFMGTCCTLPGFANRWRPDPSEILAVFARQQQLGQMKGTTYQMLLVEDVSLHLLFLAPGLRKDCSVYVKKARNLCSILPMRMSIRSRKL